MSNIYRRLLAGKVDPYTYVAVVKRAVDMGLRIEGSERKRALAIAKALADAEETP